MKLAYILQRINYKLWQYLFTQMYGIDDILDEVNNTIIDIYSYPIVWDFTVSHYDNVASAVPTANSYIMDQAQIWEVPDNAIVAIENWQEIPLQYVKMWSFTNWNTPAQKVYEYSFKWNTVYLSEAHDIKMDFVQSPREYTLADINNNVDIDLPSDFSGILKDITLSNMLPLYYSDGIPLGDRYFQKSELRLQRLSTKYGKKYAMASVGTKERNRRTPVNMWEFGHFTW